MPLKRDGYHRWVEMEFYVPGTPDEVWNAVATGPGMSAWFTETSVEERVGGKISFDFGGGMASSGTVTGWQPPHRLNYEEVGWSGHAPPVATEITVLARSGGRCVVRMVHSLFTEKDDWDDQFDGFESGWPGFFEILRLYLTNFAGQKAATLRVAGQHSGSEADAWNLLADALGVATASVGDTRQSAGTPAFGGTVERLRQDRIVREMTLLLDSPGSGIAWIGTHVWESVTRATVLFFLYGNDAAETVAREKPKWEEWMGKTFPTDVNKPD